MIYDLKALYAIFYNTRQQNVARTSIISRSMTNIDYVDYYTILDIQLQGRQSIRRRRPTEASAH